MIRHQQRRGSKLPPDVRSVARPSRWGNPWKVGDPNDVTPGRTLDLDDVLARYWAHAWRQLYADPAWLDPLRDATGLACYCPPDQRCHADILLALIADPTPRCPVMGRT